MSRIDYFNDPKAPKVNSIVAAASAVVITKDNKIVLNRRVDNDTWSLLGGAMEFGESIEDTIKREIKEEAGVDAEVIKIIGIYSDPNHVIEYSDGEVRQEFSICFLCRTLDNAFKVSNESKEVKAFSVDEITKLNIHPSQLKRINDFLENVERAYIR